MTILDGLILGIVEGLSEFLPISSTAHLILAGQMLGLPPTDFLKSLEISIQLGAILAVVIIYWKRVWRSWALVGKIAAAFIPTALIGFALYRFIKDYLLENLTVIAIALALGGLVLIFFEKYYSKKHPAGQGDGQTEIAGDISYRQAILIGLFQALAVIPGVSRAGATIIGGLSLGVSRKTIVEFSFLLAIPTMLAATAYDLYRTPPVLASGELAIWIAGFIAAFLTAIIGVKFFIRFIQRNDFTPFGWYRLALGLAILVWIWT